MEIHCKNKLIINILAISGVLLLFIAFFFNYKCVFKNMFNIPCISCGLTRGFNFILQGDFVNATKMNLLSIPLFLIIIIFYMLYILWISLKKDYIFKYYSFFVKQYKLLIAILSINWIINIIKYIF